MSPIEIKGFDPDRLEELAEGQTKIFNDATSGLPEFEPAKVEDTVRRFQRETFDQSRMFYAYDGDRMVGYAGLSGKDKELNLRGVGYPWLTEGTPSSVRDQLYEAMETKCRDEGTSILRVFGSPRYPEQLNYFKSKDFQTMVEFLVHHKDMEFNEFEIPEGYTFRELRKEDLTVLEEVSRNDPKMKSPFVGSDYEQFMNSSDYDPESMVVAEKDGKAVGFYAMFLPNDENNDKAYFGGVAVSGDHQEIERLLFMELENRAFKRGKKRFETTFFPDSPRLPSGKEWGFIQTEQSYRLEKKLD
ncbi:MAG: GNAT family N-acetyltransferase [Candidatus Thorarchaeota archaeon]